MRVGWGFDAHRFAPSGRIILGGVVVDESRGVDATSDGDVVAHAVADALLGAAVLGDLGLHFPSDDPEWTGADSLLLLRRVVDLVSDAGWQPSFVDITVIAETIRVAPHRDRIRSNLAAALGLAEGEVSVKATTTDQMGFLGQDEGLAAAAAVTVRRR